MKHRIKIGEGELLLLGSRPNIERVLNVRMSECESDVSNSKKSSAESKFISMVNIYILIILHLNEQRQIQVGKTGHSSCLPSTADLADLFRPFL